MASRLGGTSEVSHDDNGKAGKGQHLKVQLVADKFVSARSTSNTVSATRVVVNFEVAVELQRIQSRCVPRAREAKYVSDKALIPDKRE